MKPLTDHNLVKSQYLCTDKGKPTTHSHKNRFYHPISGFDFDRANDQMVLDELNKTGPGSYEDRLIN